MKWKAYVERQNETTYVLPPGWDTREQIANELECSPDRVDQHLSPGLKSGAIEKQQFRVWDRTLKKITFVMAYRKTDRADVAPPSPTAQQRPWTPEETARALSLRKEGHSMSQIAKIIGRTKSSVAHRLERAA